jgi:hypothetical protein
MEHETVESESVESQYSKLDNYGPKYITDFVPSDASEQREAFLRGDIRNPSHNYERLAQNDFEESRGRIAEIGAQVLDNPNLNPKYRIAYEQSIDSMLKGTRFMELAHIINTTSDPDELNAAEQEYMRLNIEMFGAPDERVYRSLLQEKLGVIRAKGLTGRAEGLRDELFSMVGYDPTVPKVERFKPSDETIEWVKTVVDTLYGGMLSHIPEDQKSFDILDIQRVFQEIITEEFGEAAEDWTVDIEPAKSINVKAGQKRIVIPEDRGSVDLRTLRKLVVHELGVHMLRGVMGSETDMRLLGVGLTGYNRNEEGLGKIVEQGLEGKYIEAGINPYITAGLAYHDNNDFRDIFEIRWRLAVLSAAHDGGEITDDVIERAKKKAYIGVDRIMRGTDRLPWFKDLSYYNGTAQMWQHLENIRGDDLKFTFVLLGKTDPLNSVHERVMYESASVS